MKFPIEVNEKRVVKRITIQQSISDFLDAFNVERGLIFTLKMLVTNPGKLIRFYLEDGRFRVVNAFRLLIISTAISILILNLTGTVEAAYSVQGDNPEETAKLNDLFSNLFSNWLNLILWSAIPIYAFVSFLLCKKYERFNYAEHLVIQSFFLSMSNLFTIVIMPFSFFIGLETAFGIAFGLAILYHFFLWIKLLSLKTIGSIVRIAMLLLLGNMIYYMVLFAALFNYIEFFMA